MIRMRWLWVTIAFLLGLLLIFAVVIDSLSIIIPVSGFAIFAAGIIVRFLSHSEGLAVVLQAIYPSDDHRSKQFSTPSQTIEQYLINKTRHFRDQAKNSFVPMVYKTVTNARLQYNETYGNPWEIYSRYTQFVLIGMPGVGKTMVLCELFRQLAELYLGNGSAPVPLWIPLNDEKNPVDANELFKYWWDSSEKYHLEVGFDTMLSTRPPVLLLDGLNEMPLASRSKRAQSIATWLDEHPDVHCIVTCRIRDYEDDGSIGLGSDRPAIYVVPFEKPQIFQFLRLFAANSTRKLMEQVERDDATFHLARIPLHLSMLTQLSLWHQGKNELPNRLKALYEEYLQERYSHEKRMKRDIHLSWSDLQNRMEKLAYRMISPDQKGGGSMSASERKVRKIVGKKALRDAYNLHLLTRSDSISDFRLRSNVGGRVQFFHQSLHGYFALPRLNRALQGNTLSNGRRNSDTAASIIRQIGDLGDTAEIAVDTLIPLLSSEHDNIQEATENALMDIGISAINPLIHEFMRQSPPVSTSIVKILNQIGEPTIGPLLVFALKHDEDEVSEKIATALQGVPGIRYELVNALRKRRINPKEFRGWAADALGRVSSSRAAQPLLGMLNDDDRSVRADVAWALGQIGESIATRPLVALLKTENDQFVRVYAVDAIKKIGIDAVVLLIESLRTNDRDCQKNIFQSLLTLSSTNLQIVRSITRRVIDGSASDTEIRRAAVIMLDWLLE